MEANHGHCYNATNADSEDGPESPTRDPGVKLDDIPVKHGCNFRIVVQLKAERLVVDADDSSPECDSALYLNGSEVTQDGLENARMDSFRS
jgi:hypothetical protein